ncbi:nuclear transport factor 2 family protein [Yinghuangia soli]|uniref:Nuclear transport factor 2 family protein n=1 Tax=Yinghuangia soli TaxID=2908204 RepID=A0AA41U6M5_9ACTN|nr:nuclear transport factor 2 family protein [Yinghuangia soli]MCF2531104.1 nuclear transport factor 2 family protein [Yinghuangia soli]
MTPHDHLAAHQLIHRWWFNYDEGRLEVLAGLLSDDCHLASHTETGQHPHEEFIRSDNRGPDAAMAWTREHRKHSPYPLRHHAANIHVTAERDEEVDLSSYLFVTQIVDRSPSTLSSGIVHWTLVRTGGGYKIRRKEVVLDSIESAAFHEVDFVADRQKSW